MNIRGKSSALGRAAALLCLAAAALAAYLPTVGHVVAAVAR